MEFVGKWRREEQVLQLKQWDRSNPRYLVFTGFALLVCGFNTNSTQCFLKLKIF